jgi:hypothetical protein
MKKLVALVSALCLGFVFTVGCGEAAKTTPKGGDKGKAAAPADSKAAPDATKKADEKK